jgi:hypothetical protein
MEACERQARSHGFCSTHTEQYRIGLIDKDGNKLRDHLGMGRTPKKGPIYTKHGYVLVRAPAGYTGKTSCGRVLEHRLVVEQHLGRLLIDRPGYTEIVHHINGVKTDNRLENLEIRTRTTHPPGAEATPEATLQYLEHLRINDPSALQDILRKFNEATS